HDWLWTTIGRGGQPYEFDSFRVFIWSLRHHRYETVYIEKDVKGYYPVEVSTAPVSKGKATMEVPAFSVVAEDDDGKLYRTTYAFSGNRVRVASRTPYGGTPEMTDLRRAGSVAAPVRPAMPGGRQSWTGRLRQSVARWRRRWFK
ncbi:MAG: hypothetical protein ACREH9_05470, partial [Pseudomonadota bacterium]